MLVSPKESLYLHEEPDESGKVSRQAEIFKEAKEKHLMVCVFNRKGVTRYQLYDHKKPLTEKQMAWREKFAKMAKDGTLKRLREQRSAKLEEELMLITEHPECKHFMCMKPHDNEINVCKGNEPYSCRRAIKEGLCKEVFTPKPVFAEGSGGQLLVHQDAMKGGEKKPTPVITVSDEGEIEMKDRIKKD